jgi:hypothetical protein
VKFSGRNILDYPFNYRLLYVQTKKLRPIFHIGRRIVVIILPSPFLSTWISDVQDEVLNRALVLRGEAPRGLPDQSVARSRPRGGRHISAGGGGDLAAMGAVKQ